MPAILWTFFVTFGVPIALRILIGLGVGWSVFTGLDTGLSLMSERILTNYNGLGADVLAILNLGGVGVAFNTILTSMTVSAAIRGLTATGVLSKMSWHKPV